MDSLSHARPRPRPRLAGLCPLLLPAAPRPPARPAPARLLQSTRPPVPIAAAPRAAAPPPRAISRLSQSLHEARSCIYHALSAAFVLFLSFFWRGQGMGWRNSERARRAGHNAGADWRLTLTRGLCRAAWSLLLALHPGPIAVRPAPPPPHCALQHSRCGGARARVQGGG